VCLRVCVRLHECTDDLGLNELGVLLLLELDERLATGVVCLAI
jgi:hypothetical protein